ncbi:microtubule-associated protein Jupiter-like isoform X2 [Ctenocephalides felis]|uniref:microtubule-associated protein Jupiter-like isoform X2 n=1 Tax=Ctenocephalides felis TaxID=7515 RepID=UPI000E6E1855|nr:microtubule-associated protein Jupiter-like isoform X2 [Ctenocephalides felis]
MASVYEVSANCIRVLKPPGGESSNIFGASVTDAPAGVPRNVRHQMQSSLFGPASNGNQPTPRKGAIDSHDRLFGSDNKVVNTPSKNHMKSNIGIGTTDNVDRATPVQQNGHSVASTPSSPNGDANFTNGDSARHSSSNGVTNGATNGFSGKRVPPGGFSSGLW